MQCERVLRVKIGKEGDRRTETGSRHGINCCISRGVTDFQQISGDSVIVHILFSRVPKFSESGSSSPLPWPIFPIKQKSILNSTVIKLSTLGQLKFSSKKQAEV